VLRPTSPPFAPEGFRGDWLVEPEALAGLSVASGPFRLSPSAAARPSSPADVGLLLAHARETGVPITPRGAGTGMPGGNVGHGVVLDLFTAAFAWIDPPDPDTQTIRAGAAALAAAVDGAAAAAGLTLPVLPSSAHRCSVGGMASTNAAGARSFRHGAIRDWIVGVEGYLADGSPFALRRGDPPPESFSALHAALLPLHEEVRTRWPRVRKNSSGYALDRFLPGADPVDLLIGSEGTLGVVTALTLRLAPLPEGRAALLLPLPEADLLDALVPAAGRAGASACEFLGRRLLEMVMGAGHTIPGTTATPDSLLLLEFEGSADEIRAGRARIEAEAARLGIPCVASRTPQERAALWEIRHAASPTIAAMAARGLRSVQLVEDSVVPPDRLTDYVVGMEEILSPRGLDHVIFGHAGDGNVHLNLLVDPAAPGMRRVLSGVLAEAVALVASLGGTLAGEHGDGRLRAPFLEQIWSAPLVAGFRSVKDHFDPDGVLNPGVILALEGQDPLEGIEG
jgi:FAD/FMN-containing dehydrogenase